MKGRTMVARRLTFVSLKAWSTLDDAARHLSSKTGEPIEPPELIDLAIQGNLTLSLRLQDAPALRWQEGSHWWHRPQHVVDGCRDENFEYLDGVFDLSLDEAGKSLLELYRDRLRGVAHIPQVAAFERVKVVDESGQRWALLIAHMVRARIKKQTTWALMADSFMFASAMPTEPVKPRAPLYREIVVRQEHLMDLLNMASSSDCAPQAESSAEMPATIAPAASLRGGDVPAKASLSTRHARRPRVGWRLALEAMVPDLLRHIGNPRAIIRHLKDHGEQYGIRRDEGGPDELVWETDAGSVKTATKKSIANAFSELRRGSKRLPT